MMKTWKLVGQYDIISVKEGGGAVAFIGAVAVIRIDVVCLKWYIAFVFWYNFFVIHVFMFLKYVD